MIDFNNIWQPLLQHGSARYKEEGTRRYWSSLSDEQQQTALTNITTKLKEGRFVQYDPIRAIRENILRQKQSQTLSFNDYYNRYGTTEPCDGWKMANPTGQKVIYIKN
jgi:hypothetical protein